MAKDKSNKSAKANSRFIDLIPTEVETGHKSKKHKNSKPGTLIIFDAPSGIEGTNEDGDQLFAFKKDKFKGEEVTQYEAPVDPLTGEYLPWRYDTKKGSFRKPALSSAVTNDSYRDIMKLKAHATLFDSAPQGSPTD